MRSMTLGLIITCFVLFTIDQIYPKNSLFSSPLQKALFFDYPTHLENLEVFMQVNAITDGSDLAKKTLATQRQFHQLNTQPIKKDFEKIRRGQIWRFFSPVLLHQDRLHLICNMSWLWPLGSQIEERLKLGKFCLLFLLLAVCSNVAQYFVGGPWFLGVSGVVAGFAGFIWSRQKTVPQEGYPLKKGQLLILGCFVVGMALIEAMTPFSIPIAHTAHLAGGFCGLLLGQLSFFSVRSLA